MNLVFISEPEKEKVGNIYKKTKQASVGQTGSIQ